MVITIESIEKTSLTLEEFLTLLETKPYREYITKPMPQEQHSVLQDRLVTVINENILKDKIAHAFPELRCTFEGSSLVPDRFSLGNLFLKMKKGESLTVLKPIPTG